MVGGECMVSVRAAADAAARLPADWWRRGRRRPTSGTGDDSGQQHDLRHGGVAVAIAIGLAFAVAVASPAACQPTSPQSVQIVPYKTFYVTRACEWKSNLFVPKSNDIHFAQAPGDDSETNRPGVAYADNQEPTPEEADDLGARRTMLATDSKALILALSQPGQLPATFAGYEPACSIRLIVPRNMRILAKLSSRRLHFGQLQLLEDQQQGQRQLWLNVSQAPFAETEQRSIETPANVLAFRFLLDRFASRDTRLQVVLTAFQTLSENSDLSELAQPRHQFICDQQRLISANLACDGFRNCQDGHDEDLGTCSALRAGHSGAHTNSAPPERPADELHHGGAAEVAAADQPGLLGRLWAWLQRVAGAGGQPNDAYSLAGFLLGFLLVLVLLSLGTCCLYLVHLAVWRRQRPPPKGFAASDAVDHQEAARLAASQNAENTARSQQLANAARSPSPARSILKRPVEPPPRAQRGALASSLTQPHRSPIHFRPTPAKRLTRPTRPPPLAPQQAGTSSTTSSVTGSERITTYHYSAGSLRLSQAYLERLARDQQQQQQRPPPPTPPGGPQTKLAPSSSPQSSLI